MIELGRVLTILMSMSVVNVQRVNYTLSGGTLQGLKTSLAKGQEVLTFNRIVYGKQERFEEPLLNTTWLPTYLDATLPRDPCPQLNNFKYEGKEDCLQLTIWTPEVSQDSEFLRPVVAYFGGTDFVSDDWDDFNPQEFLSREMVVVRLQYRLGILGFLTTEDDQGTGNYGLHDAIVGLKWIRTYISTFSGDKDRVSLMGEGSGSTLVQYLYVSPLTKGLFQNIIATSDPLLGTLGYNQNMKQLTLRIGQTIGCSSSSSSFAFMSCMKSLPPDIIINKTATFQMTALRKGSLDGFITPSYEKYGRLQAVPEVPLQLLKKEDRERKPVMIGCGDDEGLLLLHNLFNNYLQHQLKIEKLSEKNFMRLWLPILANISHELSTMEMTLRKQFIKTVFFNLVDFSDTTAVLERFKKFITAVLWKSPIIQTADLLSKWNVPVYVFLYAYPETSRVFDSRMKDLQKFNISGVTSSASRELLWTNQTLKPKDNRWKINFIQLIVSFIQTGNPISDTSLESWPSYSTAVPVYLSVGEEFQPLKEFENSYSPIRLDSDEKVDGAYASATWLLLALLAMTLVAVSGVVCCLLTPKKNSVSPPSAAIPVRTPIVPITSSD